MKKFGKNYNFTCKSVCHTFQSMIFFFLPVFLLSWLLWAQSCQAQTGNNWKIIVSEPPKDIHWKSIGLTKSIIPKFPTATAHSTTQGSCVIIGPDLILTVAHAIRATRLSIMVDNQELIATLIAIDTYNDRALLKLNSEYKGPIKKLKVATPVNGEIFKSYGYGRGYGYHNITFQDDVFYGDAYYGDSGGPILDKNGDVAGIICATSADPVTKKNNIFSWGWSNLYEWVEENKGNTEVKITLTKKGIVK